MKTHLRTLNDVNGADVLLEEYVTECNKKFNDVNIVLCGIAYGGDIEMAAKVTGLNGRVFAYDTFSAGHPKHLAENQSDFEATCMDHWYTTLGVAKISYPYIRGELDSMGLTNATLIEGEVEERSCDFIDKIHLAWLDMDLLKSMEVGFNAVADKIVRGGYLVTHDVTPKDHIKGLYELFYDQLIDNTKWLLVKSVPASHFDVWEKI